MKGFHFYLYFLFLGLIILYYPSTSSASFIKPIEFDTTAQETIAYDDGTHRTWWCSDRDSFGAAVKFTPREYPCQIVGTRAEINHDGGNQIYLRIYDDDGPTGLPGTILYNELRSDIPPRTQPGFKDYDLTGPVEITSGDFYVCFFQKNVWDMVFGSDQVFDSISRQFWYFPDLGWQTPSGMDAADHLIRAKVNYGVGIEEIGYDNINLFKISPNPSFGQFQVMVPYNMKSAQLEIYDICGLKVKELSINRPSAHNSQIIDLNKFSAGIYFIRLNSGGYHYVQKVVIQR